ncbi:hypothetical protein D3C75_1297110 [compost metagenome]
MRRRTEDCIVPVNPDVAVTAKSEETEAACTFCGLKTPNDTASDAETSNVAAICLCDVIIAFPRLAK